MKLDSEKEVKIHEIEVKNVSTEMNERLRSSEQSTVKLPKLELTKFDGNILK